MVEEIPLTRPPLRLGHPPPEDGITLPYPTLTKTKFYLVCIVIQKIDRNSKWCYEGEQVLNVIFPQLTYSYGPYCVAYRKKVFRNR